MTKYKIAITSSMEDDVEYFELLKMKIVDEGLLISAKSRLFGDYFGGRANKTPGGKPSTFQGTHLWKNGRFYLVERPLPPDVVGFIRFDMQSKLFWEGSPNLQWFLHTDLSKGFDLLVPEALSLNNFEDYFMGCVTAAQNFHQKVLRRGELEAKLSVEEEG